MERPRVSKTDDAPPSAVRKDATEGALRELFFIENPSVAKADAGVEEKVAAWTKKVAIDAQWVYYPWRNLAVRIPAEDVYFRLRTARNRNVITEPEQKKYRDAAVGVAGLSVGSHALLSLVATGGPKQLRIADHDTIEISNLNRINAGLPEVGENKAVVAAYKAWEIDPFADIRIFEQGAPAEVHPDFLDGLSVLIEETDTIEVKMQLREACRARRIPVVMATDNGNGAIVDVERFDLEPTRPLFHGRISLEGKETAGLSREKSIALAAEIIDPSFFTERQRASIAEIGKSLAGVAQIATAASIAGAAAAYAVRAIVAEDQMPSGRYVLGCEEAFAMSRA